MSEATTFAFVHNQSGKEMNVKIDIFPLMEGYKEIFKKTSLRKDTGLILSGGMETIAMETV